MTVRQKLLVVASTARTGQLPSSHQNIIRTFEALLEPTITLCMEMKSEQGDNGEKCLPNVKIDKLSILRPTLL